MISIRGFAVQAAFVVIAASVIAGQASIADRLAAGKLAADLGDLGKAAQVLSGVASDGDATTGQRAEALARLAMVRQRQGAWEDSIGLMQKAWSQAGEAGDGDTRRAIVRALGEALPGAARWQQVLPRLALTVDRSDSERPVLRVVWPDVPPVVRRTAPPRSAIDVDFEDTELVEVLRLIADVSRLNLVVSPGVGGHVTLEAVAMPWDEVLARALAANGVPHRIEGNVIRIGRIAQASERSTYRGRTIDFEARGEEVRDVVARLAREGGARAVVDPAISGRVTLRLSQVPWDQALDLVAHTNGLRWSYEGGVVTVTRPQQP